MDWYPHLDPCPGREALAHLSVITSITPLALKSVRVYFCCLHPNNPKGSVWQ